MMSEKRRLDPAQADPSIESTAIIFRDHDGNMLNIELRRRGDSHLCDDCTDMFIVNGRWLGWDCDTCGGGIARITQEVFC